MSIDWGAFTPLVSWIDLNEAAVKKAIWQRFSPMAILVAASISLIILASIASLCMLIYVNHKLSELVA